MPPPEMESAAPPARPRRLARRIGWVAASAGVVLLPLNQLMRPGLSPRINDYTNAVWRVGYTGRFFARHGAFPEAYHTDVIAGHASPVFYGPLLHPLLGLLSVALGPGGAVLAAAVGVWALQYTLTFRLVRLLTGSSFRGLVAGALASWAVYPLTNLYHRGAVSEFFASTFLFCAACAGGLALVEPSPRRRAAAAGACGLLGALAAGAHGITAVVGGLVLAALAPPALRLGGGDSSATRRRLAVTAMLGLGAAVVVGPWLYASWTFAGGLRIARLLPVLIYIRENDAWWARLAPVPFDNAHVFVEQTQSTGTPYLDAQLSVATLGLVAWTLGAWWRGRRRGGDDAAAAGRAARAGPLLRASLALFAALFVVSVVPPLGRRLPEGVASLVQYAYRLVTYLNLALFAALAAILVLRGKGAGGRADAAAWAVALGLAAAALAGKLRHAAATLAPATIEAGWAADPDTLAKLTPTFYGTVDYATVEDGRQLYDVPPAELRTVHRVFLPVGAGDHFGEPGTLAWDEPRDAWVVTDVVAFPWSRLVLDGEVLPRARTRDSSNLIAVRVPAGRHTLTTRFEPDRTWRALRVVSHTALVAWAAACGILAVRAWRAGGGTRRERHSPAQP